MTEPQDKACQATGCGKQTTGSTGGFAICKLCYHSKNPMPAYEERYGTTYYRQPPTLEERAEGGGRPIVKQLKKDISELTFQDGLTNDLIGLLKEKIDGLKAENEKLKKENQWLKTRKV